MGVVEGDQVLLKAKALGGLIEGFFIIAQQDPYQFHIIRNANPPNRLHLVHIGRILAFDPQTTFDNLKYKHSCTR